MNGIHLKLEDNTYWEGSHLAWANLAGIYVLNERGFTGSQILVELKKLLKFWRYRQVNPVFPKEFTNFDINWETVRDNNQYEGWYEVFTYPMTFSEITGVEEVRATYE